MQQWKKTTFKQPQNFTNILKYVHERLVQKNVFEFQIMILQERITLELDLDVCQRAIPPQKMDCPTLNAIYPITSIDLASPNVSYELFFFLPDGCVKYPQRICATFHLVCAVTLASLHPQSCCPVHFKTSCLPPSCQSTTPQNPLFLLIAIHLPPSLPPSAVNLLPCCLLWLVSSAPPPPVTTTTKTTT